MNDVESSIQYYIDHSDELIKNPKTFRRISSIFFVGTFCRRLPFAWLQQQKELTHRHLPEFFPIMDMDFYATTGSRNQADITARFRKFQKVLFVLFQKVSTQMAILTHTTVSMSMQWQQGNWIDLFYEGREKFFYLDYTLRACDKLPCPLFCAHSTGDTDVPFSEFTELSNKYHAKRFIVSGTEHDFDRDTENPFTQKVLDETVAFIEKCSNK